MAVRAVPKWKGNTEDYLLVGLLAAEGVCADGEPEMGGAEYFGRKRKKQKLVPHNPCMQVSEDLRLLGGYLNAEESLEKPETTGVDWMTARSTAVTTVHVERSPWGGRKASSS